MEDGRDVEEMTVTPASCRPPSLCGKHDLSIPKTKVVHHGSTALVLWLTSPNPWRRACREKGKGGGGPGSGGGSLTHEALQLGTVMDLSILSLIVAALAVTVTPLVSWLTTKRQISTSFALARDQTHTSLATANKKITAPMRQEWINKLRELLAELISSAQHYYVTGFEDRTDEEYQRVTLLQAHIRLMLNSNEEDHQRLEKLMWTMVTSLERAKIDEFPGLLIEVIDLSRKILKREWDRVKEPILAETSHS